MLGKYVTSSYLNDSVGKTAMPLFKGSKVQILESTKQKFCISWTKFNTDPERTY